MQTDMIGTLTTKPNIVIARSPRRIRKPNPALKLKLARADGRMTALGGVWEGWRSPEGEIVRAFAIITVPASPDIADLHDRIPLVLEERDWPAWLSDSISVLTN
jgi:putative SOS response-associated peptidase YedK